MTDPELRSAAPVPLRPIFIGGCPRSGTTLLGALLGAHSRCVCVPEMPFKVHPLHDAAWPDGGLPAEEVARAIRAHPYFVNWGIAAPGTAGPRLGYRQAVDDFVRRYASAVGQDDAEVWADHTPSNILHAATLLERFPDAVLLHLVRDGRAVAASLLPLRWGVSTITGAARVWAEHLAHGLAAESSQPTRVHRVVYEELVRDPQRVLRRICEVANLPWEPQLGTRTRFEVPPAAAYQHPLVGQPPDPSRIDAWRHSLTPRQIELFESSAGSLLQHLGYDLVYAGRARPPSRVERLRETFTEMAGELRRLGWLASTQVRARVAPRHRERDS